MENVANKLGGATAQPFVPHQDDEAASRNHLTVPADWENSKSTQLFLQRCFEVPSRVGLPRRGVIQEGRCLTLKYSDDKPKKKVALLAKSVGGFNAGF
jgi:hypothetical protein